MYLDDVVVFSQTWEEHIVHRALFDRLVKANLTVNLLKCEFAKATVIYLGKSGRAGPSASCPCKSRHHR